MSKLVKDVFLILGILAISTILFSIFFGDVGRDFMWDNSEPVFQRNWSMNTFNDGELIRNQITATFDNAVEIHD